MTEPILVSEDKEAARKAVEQKTRNLTIGNVCDECEGEGLKQETPHKLCQTCNGTGKHQLIPPGTYRSGTILVVKGVGAFQINDFGELNLL